MTMTLTDEQQTIASHFTQHMPLGVRARYEAKVCEMLNEFSSSGAEVPQREDDEAMQAPCACVDVMWSMWDEARRESVDHVATSGNLAPGGRSSTFAAATL